jgi:NAD(P)-dependent dehydrogenase (short-subunit alcohol dehydrogenase family)
VERLKGKVAVVTGAGSGIGKVLARRLAEDGASVVIADIRSFDVAAAEIAKATGAKTLGIEVDVSSEEQVAAMAAQAVKAFGRIDVLVNNAGGSPPLDAATAPAKLSEKILALNLLAPLYCAQAANAVMQTQDGGGLIINIASVSGARPSPGTAIYGAAKAGLLSLTQSLAMEWAPKVRVNAIIVGLVLTEAGEEHYGGVEGAKRVAQTIPMKRFVAPQDVANGCLLLASPLAAQITGAKLEVHGGGEPPVFLTAINNT